ncbi:LuxR family transcriptional regulator [Flavipsychrobacter stenotrophus]|uniref:LuxR family transcriptional regulator n=1 Tax=Flavipsychrobacter stenotrophus TaxID=2077091 RepID=A0A2S7T2P3_9BACT|nr:GIY-YIG nuclease family protein [Flavipsychrobacter stenotrophus]PQJ13065.1 LuxR family transcriptional regulator [Flavipsychrobacter stenotrophus]
MKTKQELKESYKLLKFKMGVFQIRNIINGKIWLSNSVNIKAAFNRNRTSLKFDSHQNQLLQNDWNEYGEDKFVFEILSELEEEVDKVMDYKKELKVLEGMYLDTLGPSGEAGYNM